MSVSGVLLISVSIDKFQWEKRRDYNLFCRQNFIKVLVYYWKDTKHFNETKTFLFNVSRVFPYSHSTNTKLIIIVVEEKENIT